VSDERYARGLEKLRELVGERGESVLDNLREVCPEMADHIIAFAFGDIYTRSGLDLKQRALVTIACLTTLGHGLPQLKVHIHGALNAGCSREEIIETILHTALYAGFPAAMNAMFTARDAFQERDTPPAA
jgi:4-carboxymuconolactone decarboxylase